jgi:hypothetical protein
MKNNNTTKSAVWRAAADSGNWLADFPQQFRPVAIQRFFYSNHDLQGRTGGTFFQALKIRAVNFRQFTQLLLGQLCAQAQSVQVLANGFVAIHSGLCFQRGKNRAAYIRLFMLATK